MNPREHYEGLVAEIRNEVPTPRKRWFDRFVPRWARRGSVDQSRNGE